MIDLDGMKMMSEVEYKKLLEKINELEKSFDELEESNNRLRAALLYATSKSKSKTDDVWVTRQDFLKIYNKALEEMFEIMEGHREDEKTPDEIENDIYGYNVTVHWHGMYCDCYDGATPSNHIIPAIESCDEEIGEE